jgi:hypothetical protein
VDTGVMLVDAGPDLAPLDAQPPAQDAGDDLAPRDVVPAPDAR